MSNDLYSSYYTLYNVYGSMQTVGVVLAIVAIIGLIASIFITFLFLPEKNKNSYTGFLAKLYNFLNFKIYWISTILKIFFIFLVITLLLGGLIILFIQPLLGLFMIISAVAIRWSFELSFVLLSMRSDLAKIANVLAPATKEPAKCQHCDAALAEEAAFCPVCGTPANTEKMN